ncbi:MAG: AAA family ATPase [Candidatus Omnitrophica bacterium]|nr:AAA family ATPase [Candidatus Omnitrophota bacterium]
MELEFNKEFSYALDILENTSHNVFITGRAGTGKSTLLEYFRAHTKKNVVVLAPTGVSAVNVKGETIHSFFHFKPDITLNKIKKIKSEKYKSLYKNIDTIIIDEVSMVRADLLDCVDKFMRLNGKNSKLPFGGVQMVFIGDLYQLPPVVLTSEKEIFNSHYKSSYFFDAKLFANFEMEMVELTKIYRQKDDVFIRILNSIRNNTVSDENLDVLNQRVIENIDIKNLDGYIYLTPLNRVATKINNERLKKIKSNIHRYEGIIDGEFTEDKLPTDLNLELKVGAQVMLLNNDSEDMWVNGTIGKIVEIEENSEEDIILVELSTGEVVEVTPYTWELFHYRINPETKMIDTEVIGKFIQYPLKLAWAMTIHKSQGKTFDKVVLDISGGIFAYGQVYVALSRCRSLDDLILTHPIKKKHIFMDKKIVKFLTSYQYGLSEKKIPLQEKIEIIKEAIKNKCFLEIIYLKTNDEKSTRIIKPIRVGEMTYLDKHFLGLEAYCLSRRDNRVFRVDRILEINET